MEQNNFKYVMFVISLERQKERTVHSKHERVRIHILEFMLWSSKTKWPKLELIKRAMKSKSPWHEKGFSMIIKSNNFLHNTVDIPDN